ncbi:MAG: hypothetical protein AAF340_07930 [Pseudomonadota bacterium]
MHSDYKPRQPAGRAENYTTAFLWSAGLVVFLALFALWAAHSYIASLVTAGFVRWGIALLPRRE